MSFYNFKIFHELFNFQILNEVSVFLLQKRKDNLSSGKEEKKINFVAKI
jgi:hypothetical protein